MSDPTDRCSVCKRPIWVEESVKLQIGPKCRRTHGASSLLNVYRDLANKIMNDQKKGLVYGRKKVNSSLSLWKKNKSLIEGW